MKITILVTYLTGGGAERVATLWAKGFVDWGHQVTIVLNTEITTISYHLPKEIKVYNIFRKENRIERELGFGMVSRLRKVFREVKPDYIICVLPSWVQLAWRAAKGMHVPIIDTEHNAFERPKDAPMCWREKLRKFVFSALADHVTVLTQADYKIISKFRKNVTVLPNPLTYPPVESLPMKEKLILACGRLDVWYTKGFDLLIEAWATIAHKYPEWRLAIAGDGSNSSVEILEDIAKKSGLTAENFKLLGRREDMLDWYKRASIFVLSSRFEGFGMVLTEAMSQGCACIACDYKGRQSEIISSDKEGIVIPVNDTYALATSIDRLIENEQYRKKQQKFAIVRSKYFSIDNIMERWNKILN